MCFFFCAQDAFDVADGKAKTKGKERRVFLFEKLLIITEPIEREGGLPAFKYVHSVKVGKEVQRRGGERERERERKREKERERERERGREGERERERRDDKYIYRPTDRQQSGSRTRNKLLCLDMKYSVLVLSSD